MEWAKAHTQTPLPIELGFSGAGRPRGAAFREYGSGEPDLQRRIGRKYGVAADRVYLVGGTSLANFVAIATFCDPGETVAVETPRYAPMAEIPRSLGARVVDLPLRAGKPLPRPPRGTKLVVLTSPQNPLGRVLTEADWTMLGRFADNGGVVVVDEVYRDLQARPGKVAAARHPRFLTTGSFTKVYGLGSLRLGWVLGSDDVLPQVKRVDNLVSVEVSTPSILLLKKIWPRLPALRKKNIAPIETNLKTLRATGLRFDEPDAALTAFVHVGDGDAVAAAMEKRGIGIARGSFFEAPEYVRIFLGAKPADFARGVGALADYLRR